MTWLRDRSRSHVEGELTRLLLPLDARLRQKAIAAVAAAVVVEQRQDFAAKDLLISTLATIGQRCLAEITRFDAEYAALLVAYQAALDEAERREILRRHLQATAQGNQSLRGDLASLDRWLDGEALRERYATKTSDLVDQILVSYDAMAALLNHPNTEHTQLQILRRAGLVSQLLDHATPDRRAPIRRAALRTLSALLRRLEPNQRATSVGVVGVRQLADYARGVDAPRWVQLAALDVAVQVLREGANRSLLRALVALRRPDDDMVIRAGAIRQLGTLSETVASSLARLGVRDPSEHVRQVLAEVLVGVRTRRAIHLLYHLALKDDSPRVRGVGLQRLVEKAALESRCCEWAVSALVRSLAASTPALVIRVAIASMQQLIGLRQDVAPERFATALARLANDAQVAPELAEQAAATLRALALDDQGQRLTRKLSAVLQRLDEGERERVRLDESLNEIIAALRVAARGDHAVALRPLGSHTYRITRGEPRRTRLWRWWHELRCPMPDKRKGYVHSHGRAPLGPYIVPPVGMAEVTPTRVPGERVLHGRIGGWGNFLPRIDDLLTATVSRQPIRLITAWGTILVAGPKSPAQRLRAFLWLSHKYAAASLVRESALEASEPRAQQSYASLVESLGFRVSRDPEDAALRLGGVQVTLQTPLLGRYLGAAGAVLGLPPDLWQQFFVHALSPNANTPRQLAVVIWIILVGSVLRATIIMHQIVRARRAVPLSIGGWGTRGKSGSERLKAALFHALRYDVVVKTTGCEAMFIHAQRDQPAQEIFIYRPYDKATIWEQRNMLEVARQLGTQVFLWECMALQPRFVETLIDEWMKDPITTLTNAYPDHEDIQGPAGEDVARVIGRFMPRGGVTFTSEEQMLPLLCDAARRKGTALIKVDPLEADLLPVDLLARLPYQEHPRNVALVLALAKHFEIDSEYALVEIADHVVLDLGVLKTYPEALHRGRRLVFSNGMSANERAGFMSNWIRLGFDRHDVDRDAESVTVAVVNNRADRVARSRVFAQIIVDDASLSSVVLINSNLGGLVGFITEALDRKLPTLSLLGDGPDEAILERYAGHLRWLKIPGCEQPVLRALERMLPALGLSSIEARGILADPRLAQVLESRSSSELGPGLDAVLPAGASSELSAIRADIIEHCRKLAARCERARAGREAIAKLVEAGRHGEIDAVFRSVYRELFLDRITVLWNTGATGDQVIDFVTNSIPPGHLGRVLGCQNIKGTGLDFVYRWLSIDRVHITLQKLESAPGQRQELLAWLGSYNDFGLLDARAALEALERIRASNDPSWSGLDNMLGGVINRLRQLVEEKSARLHAVGKADLFGRICGVVEALIDHLDSARRSSTARRVMRDLFAARIGHGRAALLLREITGRQKGGWLAKDLKKRLGRSAATAGKPNRN